MATYRAIDTLKEAGLNIKVVRLSGAKDPDEFIKKYGKDNFLNELMQGQDCVDFVLKDSAKKYDLESNLDRTKYINEALNYISKFSTEAEQEIYLSEVQKLVRVPLDALRKSLKGSANIVEKIEKEEVVVESSKDNFIIESKIMLLSSMLYKKIKNFSEISGLFTSNDELSELYRFLVSKIENNKDYNVSTLFDNFDITANSLIDRVINYPFPADDVYETYLQDTIKRVKKYELEKERDMLKSLLLNSATDEERYSCLNKLKEIENMIRSNK